MRKIISWLLATALLMGLAGCTQAPSVSNETENSTASQPSGQVSEPAASEKPETSSPATVPSAPSSAPATAPTEPADTPELHVHSYQETVTEPTCTAEGVRVYTCSCADSYRVTIERIPHSYAQTVTAPTCTKEGFTTFTCQCGDSYVGDKTQARGHSFGQWVTVKEPTTTATGLAERACSRCTEKEQKTLGKLVENHTHRYSSAVTKAATCTEEGIKTYTCSCGDKYTERIAKTSHKYTYTVTDSTCTAGGYTTYRCSTCGDSYVGNHTNPYGHAYDHIEQVLPTCTEQGYYLYTCFRCGTTRKDQFKPASGHKYEASLNTATCTEPGVLTEICKYCYEKRESVSQPKGHGGTWTDTKQNNFNEDGYIREICNICSGIVSETIIPKDRDTHTCSYTRVPCSEMGYNGATDIQWYLLARQMYQWTILECSVCYMVDQTSIECIYTLEEACEIMLGYINNLRYETYGTHEYDLQIDYDLLSKAQECAYEIVETGSSHGVPQGCWGYQHTGAALGDSLKGAFSVFRNADRILDKNLQYISFAIVPYDTLNATAVMLIH